MSEASPDKDALASGAPSGESRPRGRLRLGEALIRDGVINEEQLNEALEMQTASGGLLGETLINSGLLSPKLLVRTLAKSLGVKGCVLRHGLIDPAVMPLVGKENAEKLKVLPLFKVRDTLTVAMAEPQSLPTVDRLRALTNLRINPVLALESNITEFTSKYAKGNVNIDAFLASLTASDVEVVEREGADDESSTIIDTMVEGSPIVNLVNVALMTAVRDRASDIHIEPSSRGTRVRCRIDGSLRDLMKPPPGLHSAVVSRVKVIGKMDIAEKRLPQEGRVRIVVAGREIDLRISSIPTLLGEKLVIRILDRQNIQVRLDQLGLREQQREQFMRMLHKPHGLTLVTGPTGSGKTTTLYSALDLVSSPELNIITVEDPVEYQLDLINQIQVREGIGMTFARALRSILRQDPDVIMVGEIRDQETARVAVQAALTGHAVLATLHTNDAPGAVARLLDMGVEPYLLSSALVGSLAQRLVRTICPACVTRYYPSERVLADAMLQGHKGQPFIKGAGCQQCHDSGFQGRIGIYEIMEVDGKIRPMIHRAAPTHELRLALRAKGVKDLRSAGIESALEGQTTLEEVLFVTHDDSIESAPVSDGKAA